MPHYSTIIILGVGVLLVLLLLFCLFMLIVNSISAAGAKKKLIKIAPESEVLNPAPKKEKKVKVLIYFLFGV